MSDDAPVNNPALADVMLLRGAMAAAAQRVYDEWQQDEEGVDEDLGTGGICDGVAEAMQGVLDSAHPGIEAFSNYVETTTHVEVVVALADGVHRVDIPPSVYETGFGYVWRKRPNVTIAAEDVMIDLLDADPARYRDYVDGDVD